MNFAVIMAGGSGTRFWPASRRRRPKQLLPLGPTDEALLAATVRRVAPLIPPERVLVVTSAALVDATREVLPDVPAENFLAEPAARNTAPCVGWAASHVRRRDEGAVLAVLPADHHIGDEEGYREVLGRRSARRRTSRPHTASHRRFSRMPTGCGRTRIDVERRPRRPSILPSPSRVWWSD